MVKDILTDDSGDLLIEQGDLVIGEADEQLMQDIVLANRGDYKQYPQLGANLRSFSRSTHPVRMLSAIRTALQADGFNAQVRIDPTGEIEIR